MYRRRLVPSLWLAVDQYVTACGGRPNTSTDMKVQAAIESLLAAERERCLAAAHQAIDLRIVSAVDKMRHELIDAVTKHVQFEEWAG